MMELENIQITSLQRYCSTFIIWYFSTLSSQFVDQNHCWQLSGNMQ